MSARGFRYALEPVLTVRTWRVDTLQQTLAACNARLETLRQAASVADRRRDAALQDWRALALPGAVFDPARAAAHAGHAGRLERRAAAAAKALADGEAERGRVLADLVTAVRERDALRDHRGEQLKGYRRMQADAACKAADEHWITSSDRKNRSGDVHQT